MVSLGVQKGTPSPSNPSNYNNRAQSPSIKAIGGSFAFLLPANSAPNALAYESGYFRSLDMLRAGVVLMALAVVWVSLVGVAVWPFLEPLLR